MLTGIPDEVVTRKEWPGQQTRHPRRPGVATRTCGAGNCAVRSREDKVLLCGPPPSSRPARTPKGNLREPPVNPVTHNRRKGVIRRAKRQAARGWCCRITSPSLVERSRKRWSLKESLNVCRVELGKPHGPRRHGVTRRAVSGPQGTGMARGVGDAGESEGRAVIARIGPPNGRERPPAGIPSPKGRPLPAGLDWRESLGGWYRG